MEVYIAEIRSMVEDGYTHEQISEFLQQAKLWSTWVFSPKCKKVLLYGLTSRCETLTPSPTSHTKSKA